MSTTVRRVRSYAPGRVNLIGDHTDYSGGLVCPMAIDLGTTVDIAPGGQVVELFSADDDDAARVSLDVEHPENVAPAWARYVAGVLAVVRPPVGGRGRVHTTLPIGAGLSSSAALEVAVALALGADGSDVAGLAGACQRAERLASGVPCGIMDQFVCLAGVAGHAIVLDCSTLGWRPLAIPQDAEIVVVHSGEKRALATSAYADRRRSVTEAAETLGQPLRAATVADTGSLTDPVLRRRARHVVTENARVEAFAEAMAAEDLRAAGALMVESHASLRDDFDVSTAVLDGLVDRLIAAPGVHGARLTGAGFGGCVVALAERGAAARIGLESARVVRPSAGARLID